MPKEKAVASKEISIEVSQTTGIFRKFDNRTDQSIAENKQMEVVELKQKLEKMERQVHGQSEVKEIVAKIITITK